MLKTVWIKPRFSSIPLHSMYYELSKNPPSNYTFILKNPNKISYFSNFSNKTQNPVTSFLKYHLFSIPYTVFQIYSKYEVPERTDLIFAAEHVISSSKPWIVGLEFAGALSGYLNPFLSQSLISKKLKETQCKFILSYSEWGKNTISNLFSDSEILNKVKILRYTVSPKQFELPDCDSNIQLLFVGTINPGNLMDYEFKGLREVLEAFFEIEKKHPTTKLIIRSKVPNNIKKMIKKSPNIVLLENFLSHSEMEMLFKNSHIFVQVGYGTLTNSVLEAASYGLSIITLDLFNNSEFITHESNGLLIKIHNSYNFYNKYGMPNENSPKFLESIRKNRHYVIQQLVGMINLLIENKDLRKKFGNNVKNSIISGEFSATHRTATLKKILDDSFAN